MICLQSSPSIESPKPETDADVMQAYREDASGAAPGYLSGLLRPESEQQAAAFLAANPSIPVLFQAARTSLTAGALPRGEWVVSVEKLDRIGPVQVRADPSAGAQIRVQPGVRLDRLVESLAAEGWDFPPVPTYRQAMIGGATSTNAGGAATFKYGTVRDWVDGLRVVMSNGSILAIARGDCVARPGERFPILDVDGSPLQLRAPTYSLPRLKKISAGYHAADPLDLVDLFVGSEGTLGLITEVTLRLQRRPAAVVSAIVFHDDEDSALSFAEELRVSAVAARATDDPEGPDIRAIEWLDGRSLDLVRTAGVDRKLGLAVPRWARSALLFELEFSRLLPSDESERTLERAFDGKSIAGSPLVGWLRPVMRDGLLETAVIALPGDDAAFRAIRALREAVPLQVQEWLHRHPHRGAGMAKTGGDLIVPMDRLREMIGIYRDGFERIGVPYAIWGHLSDGNLHPNALPESEDGLRAARDLMLEFGDAAMRLEGCPLSEHGVGRNPIKQELLRRFHGDAAIDEMRSMRRALDPRCRLAPGVLFPFERSESVENVFR